MIINESNSSYFDISTTGMEKYDDMLTNSKYHEDVNNLTFRIAWMRPSDYIKRCARDIFNTDYDRLYNDRNDDKISKYVDMMKNGTKFHMPVINYSTRNQEGLHRSIAAMNIEHDEVIPVMVVYNKVPSYKFTKEMKKVRIS